MSLSLPDRLMTIREVADLLHVHARTIRRRIKTGLIQVIRTGRVVRIHPDEVKRMLLEGLSL